MKIILIGFMGVGKTTVGRLLAKRLAVSFVDLDQQFTRETGLTPSVYLAQNSEPKFRQVEQQILAKKLESSNGIISSGGGVLTLAESRELISTSDFTVIYLDSDFKVNLGRLQGDKIIRPLMAGKTTAELHELWQQRQKNYAQVAQIKINTNAKKPEVVVDEIIKTLT